MSSFTMSPSSSDGYNSEEINELFNHPPIHPPIHSRRVRSQSQHTAAPPEVPSNPPTQARKSARTTLSYDTLQQLANDPLREQRTFDFKYKEMKVQPKFYVLEGAANYPQWS